MLSQKFHEYVALSTIAALTLSGLNAPVAMGQSSNFGMSSFQAPSGANAHKPQDAEEIDGKLETSNEGYEAPLSPVLKAIAWISMSTRMILMRP